MKKKLITQFGYLDDFGNTNVPRKQSTSIEQGGGRSRALAEAATCAALRRNGSEAIRSGPPLPQIYIFFSEIFFSKAYLRSTPKFTYSLARLGIHTPKHGSKRKPKQLNLPFLYFAS